MRSIFVGIVVLSASITVVHEAQAQVQPQRPSAHGYVQPPMGYQQSTSEDLKAIEKDNERNGLPPSRDDITGVPVQSEENALTNRIDQDNTRLDRLIKGICPTC
jgi:hypothetical protein